MGAIHLRRIELVTSLSELVGYKAGIALTRGEITKFIPDEEDLFVGDDDQGLRVRSEEFDGLLCKLLYAVGNTRTASSMPSSLQMYHRFKNDAVLFPVYLKLSEEWPKFIDRGIDDAIAKGEKAIDPRPFYNWAKKKHGMVGATMAFVMIDGLTEDQHKSSMTQFRRFEWSDLTQLRELFKSENLSTQHGEFFDQRFVDYLSHNFTSIDQINWRKFEGLTCEFFHRNGFEVEIGKGRNDDSVDARVWHKGERGKAAPLILVQCKRAKDKIEKVVVKALYADVLYEQAELGLVVTTSALAPGARQMSSAREYPVVEANRDTLRRWISEMRTPHVGVFLGE